MERKTASRWAALVAALAFAAMVTVNALANALPLNGVPTGRLSDEIPNLFVPAGLTFAVWGLIYLLLLGQVATSLILAFGRRGGEAREAADDLLFALNALLNSAWIFAWHWRLVPLSLILMLGILGTLLLLAERNRRTPTLGGPRGFFLRVPVLVYLGWICVATIANATALLVTLGWDGFGLSPQAWTVAVIAVGTLIGAWFALARGFLSSCLVLVWAYAGIILKRTATDPSETRAVILAAWAGVTVILAFVALALARKLRRRPAA